MSDLLSNVLPHFVVASFGLRLCEAKPVGLQVVVDLLCPNFLGCVALDPPVNRTFLPKQATRQVAHFHSADVARPAQPSLLDLLVDGRLLLALFADGLIWYTILQLDPKDLTPAFTYSKHLYSHIIACGEGVILLCHKCAVAQNILELSICAGFIDFTLTNTACIRKKWDQVGHRKTWIHIRVVSQRWNLLIREKCL